MPVNKINVADVPQDVLGDLRALVTSSHKEIISVGDSFYELYPTPAIQLMEMLSDLMNLLNQAREIKVEKIRDSLSEEELNEFKPDEVIVTIQDILSDEKTANSVKQILECVLTGVSPEDMEVMTIGQLFDIFSKVIKVNVDTLPESFKASIATQTQQMMGTPNGEVTEKNH